MRSEILSAGRRRSRLARAGAAALALFVVAVPQTARAACPGAADALPVVVCGSAELTTAWAGLEARIAELSAAHPDLAPALAEDQALFAGLLDKTLKDLLAEHPAEEVPALLLLGMEDQLRFLQAIDPAGGAGLAGSWQNAAGGLRVTPQEGGTAEVRLSVMEPVMGLNTCSVDGRGQGSGALLTLEIPPSEELSLAPVAGSALLGLDLSRAGRPAQRPAHCGEGPPVSGWYFRVKSGT